MYSVEIREVMDGGYSNGQRLQAEVKVNQISDTGLGVSRNVLRVDRWELNIYIEVVNLSRAWSEIAIWFLQIAISNV